MPYRFKRGVRVSADRQMYIYSTSRLYKDWSAEDREKIKQLCHKCGGEHFPALFEFVTKDTTATAIEMKYPTSRATLYRIVKKYYENFPDKL